VAQGARASPAPVARAAAVAAAAQLTNAASNVVSPMSYARGLYTAAFCPECPVLTTTQFSCPPPSIFFARPSRRPPRPAWR
jgi:hypothetical protein